MSKKAKEKEKQMYENISGTDQLFTGEYGQRIMVRRDATTDCPQAANSDYFKKVNSVTARVMEVAKSAPLFQELDSPENVIEVPDKVKVINNNIVTSANIRGADDEDISFSSRPTPKKAVVAPVVEDKPNDIPEPKTTVKKKKAKKKVTRKARSKKKA